MNIITKNNIPFKAAYCIKYETLMDRDFLICKLTGKAFEKMKDVFKKCPSYVAEGFLSIEKPSKTNVINVNGNEFKIEDENLPIFLKVFGVMEEIIRKKTKLFLSKICKPQEHNRAMEELGLLNLASEIASSVEESISKIFEV